MRSARRPAAANTGVHWRVDAARHEARSPVEEISLIVEALALFHAQQPQLAFIGASEMRRSLTGENRHRIAGQRSGLQRLLDDAIARAHRLGHLRVAEPRDAGRAIATMCTSLPQWFRPSGPATPEHVARTYASFALSMLQVRYSKPAQSKADSPSG